VTEGRRKIQEPGYDGTTSTVVVPVPRRRDGGSARESEQGLARASSSRRPGRDVIVKTRAIRPLDISARELQSWRDLSDRAAEPNPFQEPDFLVPAALDLPYGAEIEVLLAEEEGRAFASIPIRSLWNWRGFPYPFVTTQGLRTLECGTPLVDTERGAEGLASILSALSERRQIGRSRILVLPQVTQSGPVFEALRTAARMANLPFIVFESWERAFLRRRVEPPSEQLVNPKLRRDLRRRSRRITEQLGAEPVLVDRTADPDAVKQLLYLEKAGYKGVAHIAMASHVGEPEFFAAICRTFAAAGRLHLLALEAGGQTLAMCVWLRDGDGLFLYKICYEERYARYGPGALMQIACMKYFHATTDASWMDTGTYRDNEMFLRLYADRRQTAGIFVPLSRDPLDRLAIRSFMALRPFHRLIHEKRNPQASHPRQVWSSGRTAKRFA
jgi:CelD/BcsL family acetyltransferase involved in cellulose biosynthesis